MAKFNKALGRWVCPVEFRKRFLDPKIGGDRGETAVDDEIDVEHDEVMKGLIKGWTASWKVAVAVNNVMFNCTTHHSEEGGHHQGKNVVKELRVKVSYYYSMAYHYYY